MYTEDQVVKLLDKCGWMFYGLGVGTGMLVTAIIFMIWG